MKRLLWLGLGAALGIYASRRMTVAAGAATPNGIGENLAEGLREIAGGLGSFGAEVRAGMDARERELNELVARSVASDPTHTGLPTYAEALAEPESSYPAAGSGGRRAASFSAAARSARARRAGR